MDRIVELDRLTLRVSGCIAVSIRDAADDSNGSANRHAKWRTVGWRPFLLSHGAAFRACR